MENFFPSKVKQEMEFHFGITLPVKSCKIASLFYTSGALHCAVYYFLNSILLLSIQTLSFPIFHFLSETGNRFPTW